MKILSSKSSSKKTTLDIQKPEMDFLLDKTISFKLFQECFLLVVKLGRDNHLQGTSLELSTRRKRFNTAAIYLFGFLSLYVVVGSIIFTLYTLKSRAGFNIFPNLHFFNF